MCAPNFWECNSFLQCNIIAQSSGSFCEFFFWGTCSRCWLIYPMQFWQLQWEGLYLQFYTIDLFTKGAIVGIGGAIRKAGGTKAPQLVCERRLWQSFLHVFVFSYTISIFHRRKSEEAVEKPEGQFLKVLEEKRFNDTLWCCCREIAEVQAVSGTNVYKRHSSQQAKH